MDAKRRFAVLWAGSSVSLFGDGVRTAALPLLAAAVSSTASGVGLVTAAGYLPWLLFALIGGVLVDRHDRRVLLWRTSLAQFAVVAVFAALTLTHHSPVLVVAAFALVLGCAETVFVTASTSVLPSLVEPAGLEQANARMQASQIVAVQFVGPLAGAMLFAWVPGIPFAFDAATFLLAALILRRLGRSPAPSQPRAGVWASLGEGLRWLWHARTVRLLAVELGLAAFALQLGTTVLVLLVVDVLHQPGFVYGLVLAAGSAGGLAASVLVRRLKDVLGPGRLMTLSLGSMGGALLLAGVSGSVVLVAVAYAIGSFGVVGWTVQAASLRQRLVPDELMGRVSAAYRLIGWGGIPLGAAASGVLGSAFGVRTPLFAGGALLLGSLALVPRLAAGAREVHPPDVEESAGAL